MDNMCNGYRIIHLNNTVLGMGYDSSMFDAYDVVQFGTLELAVLKC